MLLRWVRGSCEADRKRVAEGYLSNSDIGGSKARGVSFGLVWWREIVTNAGRNITSLVVCDTTSSTGSIVVVVSKHLFNSVLK